MKIASFTAYSDGFSPAACLDSDFEISSPFATEKPRRAHLRLKIEQLTVTVRREALPNFYGKIAIIIVADRKLQVLLVCPTG